jgi:hypothetical protein
MALSYEDLTNSVSPRLGPPKYAIRRGDRLCTWQEPAEGEEVSYFWNPGIAHREAQFRARKGTVLIYELSFYLDGRRRDAPAWLPVMSYTPQQRGSDHGTQA